MDTNNKTTGTNDVKMLLSTLWIVVMINVAMADIFGFMLDSMADAPAQAFQPSQVMMLIFAIIMEIPIAMIFLSRILKYKTNRMANMIASVITIVFVIAGGSPELHYYFFAAVEIVCMLFIIGYAWRWTNSEA